jgi:shikimate dehydrogenase
MGNPVSHSLSPIMHNAGYTKLGLNCAYIPFPVSDVKQAMDGFRAIGVRGVSVTIPHKQAVIPHLDSIDPVAKKIGAVNTLIIDDGQIRGVNTDWLGANHALQQIIDLPGKSILILGAGGSAKAIGFGLLEAGAKIMIASRTPEKGKNLAKKLNCQWHPIADVSTLKADALINATSVGMHPNHQQSPIKKNSLKNFPAVMDIVYAPQETKLLIEAAQVGCQTVNGLAMLLHQGIAQFEIWTGQKAPLELMRQTLLTELTRKH